MLFMAAPILLRTKLTSIVRTLALAIVAATLGTGCAALSNPGGDGIPVRRLPPEFLGVPKEESKTIPLTYLKQKQPDVHRVDAGDVLGLFIEGVMGPKDQPPPVQLPNQFSLNPAVGYPVVVSEDGTLPLPLIPPIKVAGLSIEQVRTTIIKAYVDSKTIQPGKEKGTAAVQILVSLLRPRQIRVQVVRQDSGTVGLGGAGIVASTRRGTGTTLDLPAYENDVLNALTRTGGLPGLDALNEIIVERNLPPGLAGAGEPQVTRIPLRKRDGDPIPFQPDDVILKNGDIVFIEARDAEVYYTGGLIVPRQFILPRDLDLRVVGAIALAGGPLVNGGTNQNNLSGNVIATGLGSPSPSRVTVLRRTKNNGQIAIQVDLNRALKDPRENILIQAGDVIILQETIGEAMTRYATSVFRYNLFDIFSRSGDFIGSATLNGP